MEQILIFITQYGISTLIIACCVIAVIGILKLCKLFEKISNHATKKLIYYILTVVLSFAGCAIFCAIYRLPIDGSYITHSCTQISATTTLYALYENFGARKLWQLCLKGIATWFKKNPDSAFIKVLKRIGLTEESIAILQAVANSELEKIKIQKTN